MPTEATGLYFDASDEITFLINFTCQTQEVINGHKMIQSF